MESGYTDIWKNGSREMREGLKYGFLSFWLFTVEKAKRRQNVLCFLRLTGQSRRFKKPAPMA
jgi:hypothetical protein